METIFLPETFYFVAADGLLNTTGWLRQSRNFAGAFGWPAGK
jgi:hypothetical protein